MSCRGKCAGTHPSTHQYFILKVNPPMPLGKAVKGASAKKNLDLNFNNNFNAGR